MALHYLGSFELFAKPNCSRANIPFLKMYALEMFEHVIDNTNPWYIWSDELAKFISCNSIKWNRSRRASPEYWSDVRKHRASRELCFAANPGIHLARENIDASWNQARAHVNIHLTARCNTSSIVSLSPINNFVSNTDASVTCKKSRLDFKATRFETYPLDSSISFC